jgi:galactokinase
VGGGRNHELEAQQLAAAQARQAARQTLVDAERRGARPAELRKHEQALADAETKPGIVGAKIEGARAAVVDAQGALAKHTREHLDEFVEAKQREGEAAVERLNELARAISQAYAERERVAQELSALVTTAGIQVRPGDISRSRAEGLARAASELVVAGGEEPPRLTRDPRVPLAGALPESLTAA